MRYKISNFRNHTFHTQSRMRLYKAVSNLRLCLRHNRRHNYCKLQVVLYRILDIHLIDPHQFVHRNRRLRNCMILLHNQLYNQYIVSFPCCRLCFVSQENLQELYIELVPSGIVADRTLNIPHTVLHTSPPGGLHNYQYIYAFARQNLMEGKNTIDSRHKNCQEKDKQWRDQFLRQYPQVLLYLVFLQPHQAH